MKQSCLMPREGSHGQPGHRIPESCFLNLSLQLPIIFSTMASYQAYLGNDRMEKPRAKWVAE